MVTILPEKRTVLVLVGVALLARTFAGSTENGVRVVGSVGVDEPGGE